MNGITKFIEVIKEKLFVLLPILFFLTPIFFFIPSLYLHLTNVEPVQRGFFCNDESLKYPFKENETIPSLICLIICMSITMFILLFKRSTFQSEIFMFLLGLSICTTDLCKFSVGGLRPFNMQTGFGK